MPGRVFPSFPGYTMRPLSKPPETERMPYTMFSAGILSFPELLTPLPHKMREPPHHPHRHGLR